MFDGNPLTVKSHLRDLERAFEPRLDGYRTEQPRPGLRVAAVCMLVIIIAVTLGNVQVL